MAAQTELLRRTADAANECNYRDTIVSDAGAKINVLPRATVVQSIHLATLHVDRLRTRLRKMSEEELRKLGRAARYGVSPTANMGNHRRPTFVLQLEEACAEWRRRHPE